MNVEDTRTTRPRQRQRWGRRLVQLARDIDRDNIVIIAAGLAFFALLCATPLAVAVVSIYGLVFDPSQVERQVNALAEVLPEEVRQVIAAQLRDIVLTPRSSLGLGAGISIVATMWAGSKGVFYLFRALNIAAGSTETRGFVRMKVMSFVVTVGGILFSTVLIALVALLPRVLHWIGVGAGHERLLTLARWPLVVLIVISGLELLYRVGRARRRIWPSPGTLVVTAAGICLSLGFSTFVEVFGQNKTYGSVSSGASVLVWLYLTAFLLLFGAELNATVWGSKRST